MNPEDSIWMELRVLVIQMSPSMKRQFAQEIRETLVSKSQTPAQMLALADNIDRWADLQEFGE